MCQGARVKTWESFNQAMVSSMYRAFDQICCQCLLYSRLKVSLTLMYPFNQVATLQLMSSCSARFGECNGNQTNVWCISIW